MYRLPLLLCSFPHDLQGLMWGDKDTFGVAFAAAGKAHLYSQVAVPPGVNVTRIPILVMGRVLFLVPAALR